jgi:hypothetical protein
LSTLEQRIRGNVAIADVMSALATPALARNARTASALVGDLMWERRLEALSACAGGARPQEATR